MSYNSKYTGQQVENLLDQVNNGTGGNAPDLSGYATKEELNGKVDKVDGKQLSTEDFTTELKNKLSGLTNYDDSEIQEAVSKLRTDLDTLVSGDTTTAIKTFNEIIAFLDGIEDSESLDSIIASIEQQIATKQDKINDLQVIREGAAKGATALQEHQDLSGKQDKLVSGENIKTINGESVLGEGDLKIKAGNAYPIKMHKSGEYLGEIAPNVFHIVPETDYIYIIFGEEVEGVVNEYVFQFKAFGNNTSLTVPDTVQWVGGYPIFEGGKTYQVSIVNNIGLIVSV